MDKNRKHEEYIAVQSTNCQTFDETSICAIDIEFIDKPTKALLHQQSRFLYILEGKGKILIQGNVFNLNKGALIAILPWQYSEIIEVEEPLRYYLIVYKFDIINSIIKKLFNVLNEDVDLINAISTNNAVYCDQDTAMLVENICRKISKEIGVKSANISKSDNDNLSPIFLNSLIIEILVTFYRAIDKKEKNKIQENVPCKIEIFQYIYMHLSEKVTLKQLSNIFYMSESAISKYIYDTVGFSYSELIAEMRVAKTINFLLYTDLTLEEVAKILGYVDASHVSKIFSRKVGIKAKDYRKTYSKINEICKIKRSKKPYQIISYIFNRYNEDITVNSVAENFNITVVELNQILKYQVEKSFEDFLNSIRINQACELLLNTGNLVSDIAYEVGFNNTKTFTRNFYKYQKMTPSDFRRKTELQKS